MTKQEMLKAVDEKVQHWVWEKYIPGFDSKKDMANSSLSVAAVMCMADMIHSYVCDPGNEEIVDDLFCEEGSLQEFYDFFIKHDMTLDDIAKNWLMGDDLYLKDILGLYSWGSQLEDMLLDIHWLIKYTKRKEVK